MNQKNIVLTGGGSGGHFYPLMAVGESIATEKDTGLSVTQYYLGPTPYNQSILDKHSIKFIRIPAGKKTKYFSFGNFFTPFKIIRGTIISIFHLYKIYPDVIFSKGSYTSLPVTLAGFLLRIPIVVHESDTKIGSANKIAAKWARYIAISYDDAAVFLPAKKTALTGVPLQASMLHNEPNALAMLGIPEDKPLIFVTGGSQGSSRINKLILESLDELLPNYCILHQTGKNEEESTRATAASLINDSNLLTRYFVLANLNSAEMNLALSGAALVISRAGSGTIFEIANKGIPAIIIPIPENISHDQRTNAFAYSRSGAASVIEEGNLTDGLLTAEINRIMSDTNVYNSMSDAAKSFALPNAAASIARTLLDITREHR